MRRLQCNFVGVEHVGCALACVGVSFFRRSIVRVDVMLNKMVQHRLTLESYMGFPDGLWAPQFPRPDADVGDDGERDVWMVIGWC